MLVGPDPRLNELGRLVGPLIAEPSPLPVRPPTRAALMLTLRLGLRALETCSLEWRAVDLDGAAPSITVTRSKTGAGLRALPLPRAAVEILREFEGKFARRPAVSFPGRSRVEASETSASGSLSRAFARACDYLGIADASTHDLRRTFLSGLIELGHESVADRIAGHIPRHVMGRHYDRSKRLDAMRDGLEAWSAAVDAAAARYAKEVGK